MSRRKNNQDKFDDIQRLTKLQLELHKHNIGEILKNNSLTKPSSRNKAAMVAELGVTAFQLARSFKKEPKQSGIAGLLTKIGGNSIINKLIRSFINRK